MQYESECTQIILDSPQLMRALRAGLSVGLANWCIGAGAIRNRVWDELHGRAERACNDIDFVYFDTLMDAPEPRPLHNRSEHRSHKIAPPSSVCQGREHEHEILNTLLELEPDLPWEVTNQAYVHTWYKTEDGESIAAHPNLASAIATWPETATCVGVFLDQQERIRWIAPHGLSDLYEIKLKYNPSLVSYETFLNRKSQKQFEKNWPKLVVLTA